LKQTGELTLVKRQSSEDAMKLVYAVSQRTKAKPPTARHIDNGEGRPLCGGNGREPFFWAPEEGEPTCRICMDLALMLESEPEQVNARQAGGE
jgi:hypothetical protein